MTRVTYYKLGYLIALVLLGGVVALLVWLLGVGVGSMLIVAAAFLIPGRIQGICFRGFFKGRRLLDSGEPSTAVGHFEDFLQLVRREPWRKRLLWLTWSVYTPDMEAMTLNNIGVSQMTMGNTGEAKVAFDRALSLDPKYPLPHFNLAVLAIMKEDQASAEEALKKANMLGYRNGTIDAAIRKAQSLLARLEGHGISQA
jgi:tetratricopeptide (TPR) repeat protein